MSPRWFLGLMLFLAAMAPLSLLTGAYKEADMPLWYVVLRSVASVTVMFLIVKTIYHKRRRSEEIENPYGGRPYN